jgi:hypothetical protein
LIFWRTLGKETGTNEDSVLTTGRIVNQETCLTHARLVSTILVNGQSVLELSCQARGKSWEHCGSASEHDVLDKRKEIVHFTRVETAENLIVESTVLNTSQLWSKHAFGSLETLSAYFD